MADRSDTMLDTSRVRTIGCTGVLYEAFPSGQPSLRTR